MKLAIESPTVGIDDPGYLRDCEAALGPAVYDLSLSLARLLQSRELALRLLAKADLLPEDDTATAVSLRRITVAACAAGWSPAVVPKALSNVVANLVLTRIRQVETVGLFPSATLSTSRNH